MKNYCLLGLITFLISVSVVAQRGINKGKIYIKNTILEGYISISVYDETHSKFTFSENEKGPFRPISSEEISKVEYDNGITFEKHYINVENSKQRLFRKKSGGLSLSGKCFFGLFIYSKIISRIGFFISIY
jgi:hypothetical protein